ncbi:MAG: His/Gly/Thr/Pro-type tRNA ligase C-terminal domain-containing protein, partial [Pseudomonadota bacterium]
WRITVGPRGLKNGVVEVTSRRTGESEELPPEQAVRKIAEIYSGHHGSEHVQMMGNRSFHTYI